MTSIRIGERRGKKKGKPHADRGTDGIDVATRQGKPVAPRSWKWGRRVCLLEPLEGAQPC